MDVLSTGGLFSSVPDRRSVPADLSVTERGTDRWSRSDPRWSRHIIRCRASATPLAKPRHAQGISAQLAMWTRPAPCDVTFTSRWRQRSERIEPRTYSADASVDHTSITPKRARRLSDASVECDVTTGSSSLSQEGGQSSNCVLGHPAYP